MFARRKTRGPALILAAAVLAGALAGCAGRQVKMETQIFAMDTVMSLAFYGTGSEDALQGTLDGLAETVYDLQDALSATDPDSDIYLLNHADGAETALSPAAVRLLSAALELCAQTEGALDLTAYRAVEARGFTTGEYRAPGPAELAELADHIDYTAVELNGEEGTARLPEGMELDLGSVAKGYAGDLLAARLRDAGVASALLDLGRSSIQAVGSKPDGSPWRVGIQDPAGEDYLAVLEIEDQAVGTSGGYQRYFEQDGTRYWHIIDPATAAPARSGLASVTVVGASGLVCDGLSTALFVMGLEEGADFWRGHSELDVQVIFISDDGSITITPGLSEVFSLAEEQEGREVTVLE